MAISNMFSKKNRKWTLLAIGALAVVALLGFRFYQSSRDKLPEGIASGNGRLDAQLVDASAKEPLRVKEVLVHEGDLVKPGQVLVRLDATTIKSQMAEAQARVAAA